MFLTILESRKFKVKETIPAKDILDASFNDWGRRVREEKAQLSFVANSLAQ